MSHHNLLIRTKSSKFQQVFLIQLKMTKQEIKKKKDDDSFVIREKFSLKFNRTIH